jgi:hypothetical protein
MCGEPGGQPQLLFAQTAAPSQAADWEAVQVNNQAGLVSADYDIVPGPNGRLHCVYYYNDGHIWYTRTPLSQPSSAGACQTYSLAATPSLHWFNLLFTDSSKPLLVFERLNLVRSMLGNAEVVNSPAEWGTEEPVTSTSNEAAVPSMLAMVGGEMAFVFGQYIGNEQEQLSYVRAEVDEPLPFQWDETSAIPSPPIYNYHRAALADLGGKPAFAVARGTTVRELWFHRSTAAQPTGSAAWENNSCLVDSAGNPGSSLSMQVLLGRPVILYIRQQTNQLAVAWSSSAAPGASGDWLIRSFDTAQLLASPVPIELQALPGRLEAAVLSTDNKLYFLNTQ